MATQAAYQAEKVIGHGDNAVTAQDVTSYREPGAGESGETMKALAWISKNKVQMGMSHSITDTYTFTTNTNSRRPQAQDH